MFSPSRIVGVVCGAAVLTCLLACGATQKVREAADRQKRTNDLKQIVNAMHNYHDAHQTFPPNQQALLQADPGIAPFVQSGQYTILYGAVRLVEMTEGTSNTVVAYENLTRGGHRLVATADGAVMMMPEAEFAAKPRLKPKPAGGGGPGVPDRQKRTNELRQIAAALLGYHDANQTFPADQQAFIQWAQRSQPQVVPLVQSGQYTVLYAPVRIVQLIQGTTNTIAAYENQPAGGDRLVAMADGSVRGMMEAEFNTKPRLNAVK